MVQMATRPEFEKDDYFKIDVECHLSGEANKKYFNYFPNTESGFTALPKQPAHSTQSLTMLPKTGKNHR